MTLRLNGSTSGYTEIDAPAVAGSNTLVLPTGNGTADQVLAGNGSGALSWVNRGRLVLETAKSNNGSTNVEFTGIPSWAKRIRLTILTMSTNGTSVPQLQVGSGSYSTGGYAGQAWAGASSASGVATTGVYLQTANDASWTLNGIATLQLISNNQWIVDGTLMFSSATSVGYQFAGYTPALSGPLDRIRIITVNSTDTFDSGAFNILYEG